MSDTEDVWTQADEEAVEPCDEASAHESDASDPGEVSAEQAASSDDWAASCGLRWSGRASQPPERLAYDTLGGINPTSDSVTENASACEIADASAVHIRHEERERRWWDWIHDTMESLSVSMT